MQVSKIERFDGSDRVSMFAVTSKPFDADGNNEDNTYAKFSPSGEPSMTIANPALLGKI